MTSPTRTRPADQARPADRSGAINDAYDIKSLAAAVIVQAVRDAKRGHKDAVIFLQRDAQLWIDFSGFDINPDALQKIINQFVAKGRGAG